MIFQRTHRDVLSGRKTVTRRVVKPRHLGGLQGLAGWVFERPRPGVEYDVVATGEPDAPGRVTWWSGGELAVQPGRTQSSLGRVRVTSLRCERLVDITPDECAREGFPDHTPEQFVALFSMINKIRDWQNPDRLVWRIEFRRI